MQGLAEHKDELGAPLCPCRHYDDKAAEAAQGFWNCPCVPMRERKVSAALFPVLPPVALLLSLRAPAPFVSRLGKKPVQVMAILLGPVWLQGRWNRCQSTFKPASARSSPAPCPLQECHCMLFLTEDNDFRGDDQVISLEEVVEATADM